MRPLRVKRRLGPEVFVKNPMISLLFVLEAPDMYAMSHSGSAIS